MTRVASPTLTDLTGAMSARRRLSIAFTLAVLARGLSWCFAEMFLACHLHAHGGLTAGQTGTTLFILLSIGAIADLGAGWLLRERRGHRGSLLRMQRAGAVVAALATIPLFLPGITIAGALAWGAVYRVAFSFYAIPQTALLGVLAVNHEERRRFVRLHAFATAGARLLTACMAFAIVGEAGVGAWSGQTMLAVFVAACVLASVYGLERTITGRTPTPVTDMATYRESRVWPMGLGSIVIATVCHAGSLYMVSRMFLFTPPHAAQFAAGPWFLIAWTIGMTLGPFVSDKGHRHLFPFAMLTAAVASTLILAPDLSMIVKLAAAVVYGLGLSVAGVELLAKVTHLSTDGGGVTDGRIFALFGFTAKAAMAVGNGALAFLVDDYVSGSRSAAILLALVSAIGAGIGIAAWVSSQPRLYILSIVRPPV